MYSVPKSGLFKRYMLASSSPRRKDILISKGSEFGWNGYFFKGLKDLAISSSTFEEENKHKFEHLGVYDYISEIATGKVRQVADADKMKTDHSVYSQTLFIGSDTVVLMNGQIFEKPTSVEDARNMLSKFSGGCHEVCSAVVLLVPSTFPSHGEYTEQEGYFVHKFTETSKVEFGKVSADIIDNYIATGEPMDKAGGYGIQGLGAQLVKAIHGDYYNVMGFPLYRFCQELNQFITRLTG